jgi:hypothetical protein
MLTACTLRGASPIVIQSCRLQEGNGATHSLPKLPQTGLDSPWRPYFKHVTSRHTNIPTGMKTSSHMTCCHTCGMSLKDNSGGQSLLQQHLCHHLHLFLRQLQKRMVCVPIISALFTESTCLSYNARICAQTISSHAPSQPVMCCEREGLHYSYGACPCMFVLQEGYKVCQPGAGFRCPGRESLRCG